MKSRMYSTRTRMKKKIQRIEHTYFIEFVVGMPIEVRAESKWDAILSVRKDGYNQPIERITENG